MPTRDFLSVQAVASELGIAEPTVRTAIRSKRLPSERIDGVVSVAREDVEAYRRRTQAEGGVRRGRPRNLSVTERDTIIGADLTPEELERAKLFGLLTDHDRLTLDRTLEALRALRQGGSNCKLDTVIEVVSGQAQVFGGVHIYGGGGDNRSAVEKANFNVASLHEPVVTESGRKAEVGTK